MTFDFSVFVVANGGSPKNLIRMIRLGRSVITINGSVFPLAMPEDPDFFTNEKTFKFSRHDLKS